MTSPPAARRRGFRQKAYHTEKNHRAGHQIQATRLLFNNTKESRITKIGAVYCSTMALAAVVILLASAKSTFVPHTAAAPSNTQRFSFGLWRVISKYAPNTPNAMMLRPPLRAIPLHGINFMQSPAVLYRTAARNTNIVPLQRTDIFFPFFRSKEKTHRPLHADRGRSQTRYHLWFTHILTHIGLMLCHHTACALSGASRPALLRLSVQAAAQRRIHKVHLSPFTKRKFSLQAETLLLFLIIADGCHYTTLRGALSTILYIKKCKKIKTFVFLFPKMSSLSIFIQIMQYILHMVLYKKKPPAPS